MNKVDTRYFTDDNGTIQTSKLGRLIIERRNIVLMHFLRLYMDIMQNMAYMRG